MSQLRDSTSLDNKPLLVLKEELEMPEEFMETECHKCVVCLTRSLEGFDIFITHTNSSKTSVLDFLRKYTITDHLLSQNLVSHICKMCLHLVNVLEHTEIEYLKAKDDFESVISKNPLFRMPRPIQLEYVKSETGYDSSNRDHKDLKVPDSLLMATREENDLQTEIFVKEEFSDDIDTDIKQESHDSDPPGEKVNEKATQEEKEISLDKRSQYSQDFADDEPDAKKQKLSNEELKSTPEQNNTPPEKKENYSAAYESFINWKTTKNHFCENIFIEYFKEISAKYNSSSIWSIYSRLKSTVLINNGVDIRCYSNLLDFLKKLADGCEKSRMFSPGEIEQFLKRAPDSQYLVTKVALIFALTGACTRDELHSISATDIEDRGDTFQVTISTAKEPRSFTISGPFYETVDKYRKLRIPKTRNEYFFQNYHNGRCTSRHVGLSKFATMPKEVAKFLELADPDSYTGHSFRNSAIALADAGADIYQ